MVQILEFPGNPSQASIVDEDDLPDIEWYSLDPISALWPENVQVQLGTKFKPKDYFATGPARVVCSQFMNACLEFEVNAEFLPVQLLAKDGSAMEEPYHLIRVLQAVDCFDWDNSDYTLDEDDEEWIEELDGLVIDEAKAAGHHFFRVDVSSFILAASEEFAAAVKRLKLKGVNFIPPSEWSVTS